MSYIKKTVNIYGTEKQLVQEFINEFTSADSRIVCETTDIDAQFSDTGNIPTFIFNINNNCYIEMKRMSNLTSNMITYYIFSVIANDTTYYTAKIQIYSSSSIYNQTLTRGINFAVASNDNAIYITIGSYNVSVPSNADFAAILLSSDSFCAVMGSTSTTISNFYCTDTENSGTCVKLFNRIGYEIENGKIEIINSKVLTDTTISTKFAEVKDLIDCSTVVPYNIITIDDKKYLAIDNHTLILINAGDD